MSELTQVEKYRQGIAEARTEAERLRRLATHESVTAWIRVVIRDLDDADRWIAEIGESFLLRDGGYLHFRSGGTPESD